MQDYSEQRKLIVDSFVGDGVRSGYGEGFVRGLSMYVRVGKELGEDAWQGLR